MMKTQFFAVLGVAGGMALFAGPLVAQNTAVTAPAGYRTETLQPGVFNLLSSNLNNAVSAAGEIDSASFGTLTDTDVDFTSLLTGTTGYTVKITSGAGSGTNSLAFPNSGGGDPSTLFTIVDFSGTVAAGDSYEVRATQTIADLFGPSNEAGLKEGTSNVADVIWVPSSGGHFSRVYYNDGKWRVNGYLPPIGETEPVYFTDSIYVQRRGSTPIDVVFTGHVDTRETVAGVDSGFNFLSRVIPVGVALDDSGLDGGLASGDQSTADIVWTPTGMGETFQRYFFDGSQTWRNTGELGRDSGQNPLTSGYLVQRRGGPTDVTITYPTLNKDGGGVGGLLIRQPTDPMGFQISVVERDSAAGTATVTWGSKSGATYRILETNDLKTYTQIGQVTASAAKTSFTDSSASEHCTFYVLESDDL